MGDWPWNPDSSAITSEDVAAVQEAEHKATVSLEALIEEFTHNPTVFLRELVQNAIDAQIARGVLDPIQVTTEFRQYGNSQRGLFEVTVTDRGIGMTRKDIDCHLTQIFATPKTGNSRFIGKFGIGFLSVFAFNPNAVIVKTGRDGEFYQLIFKENRKFDRIELREEVEGTTVQVIKEMANFEIDECVRELESTLRYWCRMAEVRIEFNHSPINESFEFPGELSWSLEEPSTKVERLSIQPAEPYSPRSEIFHHGFLVEQGDFEYMNLPGLRFRVDSPLINRQLPSNMVCRDEVFETIMKSVSDAASGPYLDFLLTQAIGQDSDLIWESLSYWLSYLKRSQLVIPVIPSTDGTRLNLLELARQVEKNQLFWSAAKQRDLRIVRWDGKSPGLGRLLRKLNHVEGSFLRTLASKYIGTPDVTLVEKN